MFHVVRRRTEVELGAHQQWLDREARARTRSGQWQKVHRGIYIVRDGFAGSDEFAVRGEGEVLPAEVSPDEAPPDEAPPDEVWRGRLLAHLERGGSGAAVSHRAAARLWGLDGDWGDAEDLTVPVRSAFRCAPAVRSRSLLPADCTVLDGIALTRIARTLIDLGRFIGDDELELAVESAFRGDDPRRPREWHDQRLALLQDRLSSVGRAQPGASRLRAVLARRGAGVIPTGSAAETLMVQILRGMGVVASERQPEIRYFGHRGELMRTLYPDVAIPSAGLLIEVDGADAHIGKAALERDLERQNMLHQVFPLLRFSGTQVRGKRGEVVDTVRRKLHGLPEWESPSRDVGPYRVTRIESGFDVRLLR